MTRQLDPQASERLKGKMETNGIDGAKMGEGTGGTNTEVVGLNKVL